MTVKVNMYIDVWKTFITFTTFVNEHAAAETSDFINSSDKTSLPSFDPPKWIYSLPVVTYSLGLGFSVFVRDTRLNCSPRQV